VTGDEVRRRLDEAIQAKGTDYATVSRLLGRNSAYVQQFIRRGVPRRLDERDRKILAHHLQIPEEELGAPEGFPVPQRIAEPESRERRVLLSAATAADPRDRGAALRDYVLIPYVSAKACGPDATAGAETAAGDALAFETGFARALGSGRLGALSAIRVEGDAMVPTLLPGDQILVDADDSAPLRDGIYVLRLDDAFAVKRISVNPATRRLTLKADNPIYAAFEDCDPAALQVLGRVVWIGRRLG
jgi:phage repressor protein C with HTH and peptisase S24 domain